jgi:hypothetical protein
MFFLSVLHYSLVKGVYKKRWKGINNSISGLSFFCILILFLFLFFLFIDKELLWDIIRKRLPLGPMAKGIAIILLPIIILLSSVKINRNRIKTIRKVILIKRNFKFFHSVLYILFYITLFLSIFFISIISRPSY